MKRLLKIQMEVEVELSPIPNGYSKDHYGDIADGTSRWISGMIEDAAREEARSSGHGTLVEYDHEIEEL